MPTLAWDEVGDRKFQAGVDHGVLYLPGQVPVVWNGLTGVDEAFNQETQAYYQDGVKYLGYQVLGEYSGTLKAFTYPDEFEQCIGLMTPGYGHGLLFHDQRSKSFGLSYRTKIGNDVTEDLGYTTHLLYNLHAGPSSTSFATIGADTTPLEFSWELTSTPDSFLGYRPTAHLSFKSTELPEGGADYLEWILYGNDEMEFEATLPSISEMVDIFQLMASWGGG